MWLTYLLVVSIALSPFAYPDSWSFDPPLVITPARFHKKKRASLAMHCLARSWYCKSLDMAQLDIFEFLLRHGFRQEILGCHPVWLGSKTASCLMNNFPFNPSLRDLPVHCRSRLYSERYWLRYTAELLCVGVSTLNSFPGSGSAGLGLFADCSANHDVP